MESKDQIKDLEDRLAKKEEELKIKELEYKLAKSEEKLKEEKPTNSESSPKGYEGLYCSSDDKVLFGFCGGLAHKFKVDTTVVRIAVFLAAWFCIGWIYFVGLFLPKLPTKNI